MNRQEKDLITKHIPLLKATMSNRILTAEERDEEPLVKIKLLLDRHFARMETVQYLTKFFSGSAC